MRMPTALTPEKKREKLLFTRCCLITAYSNSVAGAWIVRLHAMVEEYLSGDLYPDIPGGMTESISD